MLKAFVGAGAYEPPKERVTSAYARVPLEYKFISKELP